MFSESQIKQIKLNTGAPGWFNVHRTPQIFTSWPLTHHRTIRGKRSQLWGHSSGSRSGGPLGPNAPLEQPGRPCQPSKYLGWVVHGSKSIHTPESQQNTFWFVNNTSHNTLYRKPYFSRGKKLQTCQENRKVSVFSERTRSASYLCVCCHNQASLRVSLLGTFSRPVYLTKTAP